MNKFFYFAVVGLFVIMISFYGLIENNNRIILPLVESDSLDAKSIVLYKDKNYKLSRSFPNGYIDVYFKDSTLSSFKKLNINNEWRKNTYPMLVFKGLSDDLYIISYDTVANIPSGRRLIGVRSGFDLYKITKGSKNIKRVAENISLGGIDDVLYASYENDEIHICGSGGACLTVNKLGEKNLWNLGYIKENEFVEVSLNGGVAAAILRKKYDGRSHEMLTEEYSDYYIAEFNINGMVKSSIKVTGIPYKISWNGDQSMYKLANSSDSYKDILYYDLSRMPVGGVMEFGSNNLEGRVAWRQVYYLNGLISILSNQLLNLTTSERNKIKSRLGQELQFIVDLYDTRYPGYLVRRYSMDREPLLFALHLGRIAALLSRAEKAGVIYSKKGVVKKLLLEMQSLENTVEEKRSVVINGKSFDYYFYKKGVPFWADGVNVPYNYVSGVVDGVLSSASEDYDDVIKLMQPLLLNELEEDTKVWNYWFGLADKGWSEKDSYSLNTPSYLGDGGRTAHITYRTMDAKAILRVLQYNPDPVLLEKIYKLVEDGYLFPDVNEYLYEFNKLAIINDNVAKRHSRSSSAWEIQSQVWALDRLSELVLQK